MKIAIVGATGMVGSAIAHEAVQRGHDVTAFSRSGSPVTGAHASNLTITDTAKLAAAINDHDLTVVAVAGRDDHDAVVDAHRSLIEARPTGRILVVGGAGSLRVNERPLYESPEFPAEFLTEAKTFGRVYEAYTESGDDLNWTIATPSPVIEPGERTGKYVSGLDSPVGDYVSTQDFAVAVIDEAEHSMHPNRRFTVASSRQ